MNNPVAPTAPAPAANASTPTAPAPTAEPAKGPKALSFKELTDDNVIDPPRSEPPKQDRAPKDNAALEDDGLDDDLADEEDFDDDGEDSEGIDPGESEDDAEGDELDSDIEDEGDADEAELHEVTVDGQTREYTLQQMKDIVSSGAHQLHRQNEFNNYATQKDAEIQSNFAFLKEANDAITPAWEAIKGKDVQGAILALAKTVGLRTLDMRRKLREDMIPIVGARLGLSPAEIQDRLSRNRERNSVWDTQEENEFLRIEAEEARNRPPAPPKRDLKAEAQEAIRKTQVERGVADWEVKHAVEFLMNKGAKANDLTIDSVFGMVSNRRIVDRAFDAIESVKPSLKANDQFVDKVIAKLRNNPRWTTPDTARFVRKLIRRDAASQEAGKKDEANRLAKTLGNKVLKGNNQARLESPNAQQEKPKSFRDLGDRGLL